MNIEVWNEIHQKKKVWNEIASRDAGKPAL